ncbi:MAG: PAS domain-containing protein [Candidatus Omnitrophica bacterium]|nr:PAS domain-containing protein [Candidatus Omnitrophota bacterium]
MSKEKGRIKYRKLAHKYRLLEELMRHTPDVIYFKDRQGKLVMVNDAHAKGLGLKPTQVIGKTDYDFFPKKRAAHMAKDDMEVIETGKAIVDKIERATRADGIDNYVSTTKIPRYDDNGRVIGLIGITRDITQRMQYEQLRDEKVKIEEKLGTVEELNKLKSEFVSVVSHELRTPLAIINEAVELLSDKTAGAVNDVQAKLLKTAKNNVKRLKGIIEDLLDLSRIEGGKLKLNFSLVNLADILRDSADFFIHNAQEKGVEVEYIIPREEVNIFVDPDRINQVVTNLINNALKFTERGGRIKIELKVQQTKVRIGVIDTGIGISREDLSRLFNKFVQVTDKSDAQRRGVGLGLSIAKELVEKHSGEIWVESKVGVGSKFYFTLSRFYTTSGLDKDIRKRINALLGKELPLYLINIFVVNYKEFKKMLKISHERLFKGLTDVVTMVCNKFEQPDKENPQIVLVDMEKGEASLLFPQVSEKEAEEIYRFLKKRLENYLKEKNIENVFINLGILSYPFETKPQTTQQLLSNLYIKRIFIGSNARRFRRVPYRTDVEINLSEKTYLSRTLDISEGGVSFIGETPLEKNAKVELKLNLSSRKKPLLSKARIAWVRPAEKIYSKGVRTYHAGAEFVGLTDKEKKLLSGMIDKLSKE